VLRGGVEEECSYSCMYNTQTSTQQHHLTSVHKEFEKEKKVGQVLYYMLFYSVIC
jgi:hypothetical protein